MDDYMQDWQSFKPSDKSSYMDMDMQVLNQLAGQNPIMSENFKSTDVSVGTFLAQQQPKFPASPIHIFPNTTFQTDQMNEVLVLRGMALIGDDSQESKETKAVEQSKSSSKIIASTAFGNGSKVDNDTNKNESSVKEKKGIYNEKEVEKSEEGIHVRARRGQATDSRSLAERVRRQKINSRFSRLKDLVPGCYKTMGMAAMLDEIINYVHSLQNQVEFLSLELASASSSYNNSETHAIRRSAGSLFQELECSNHLFSSQLLMD